MATSGQYSRSILGASDEVREINCEPCHKAGRVVIADSYCVDCAEYLCGQCLKSHRRNKILANHVLLDKDSMPVVHDNSRSILDVCEEKCPIHPSKVTEFFCETCDKLGCHICVTLNHRQCEKVKHIPDIVKDLEQTEEFKKFNRDIELKVENLFNNEEMLRANVTSNNEMRKLAKQELVRQRAEVNIFFDQLEKKMDDQITAIEKRNNDTLKAASDRMQQMKKEFDQVKNDVEAKKTGKNCELFIAMKRGKKKMVAFSDHLNKMREELGMQHYRLFPSEQIQAMMRTTTEICRIATARLESEIDIKTSTDKEEPRIEGLTIMHGHYCVAVDNANRSFKVINTQSKHVTSEIKAENIWSVTSVSDDKVAVSVSLPNGRNQIQIFTVSASGVIQSTKMKNVDKSYSKIIHYKGNIYGKEKCRIDVLNMKGKIIRTIQLDDKSENLFRGLDGIAREIAQNMFRCLDGIALSPDGQTIYVTNNHEANVTSMTLDGKVKAVYKDKDLIYPWGITVDKHGYVYVCCGGTYNIHQLTADLNKVQVIIDSVGGNEITYSSAEHKLYIDQGNKIYQYSLDNQATTVVNM